MAAAGEHLQAYGGAVSVHTFLAPLRVVYSGYSLLVCLSLWERWRRSRRRGHKLTAESVGEGLAPPEISGQAPLVPAIKY